MNKQAKIRARSVPGTPEAFVLDIQVPQFPVFSSRMDKETAQKTISAFQRIYSLDHPLESIHEFVEVCTKNLIEFQYTLNPVKSSEPWVYVPSGELSDGIEYLSDTVFGLESRGADKLPECKYLVDQQKLDFFLEHFNAFELSDLEAIIK